MMSKKKKKLVAELKKGSLALKLMQISWQIPEQYLHDQCNEDFDTFFTERMNTGAKWRVIENEWKE